MAQWDEQGSSNTYNPPESRANGSGALNVDEAQAQMQELIENARAEIDRYVGTAADFIRQRPVACVAGALAIGFLVGKIASRR